MGSSGVTIIIFYTLSIHLFILVLEIRTKEVEESVNVGERYSGSNNKFGQGNSKELYGAAGIPQGCPHQFGGRCACEYRIDKTYDPNPRKQKYFVDCDTSGFKNTSMLEYLPVETEVLIFTGNQLSRLRSRIFGKESRLPNLSVIDMSNNQITQIDEKAFDNVENVQILNLAHNRLSNSSLHNHPRLFSNFGYLRELYLTNTFDDEVWSLSDLSKIFLESNLSKVEKIHLGLNELSIIPDPSAFCPLSSLRHLYIPQNELTDDVLLNTKCLPDLEVIDLRENKIQTINPKSNLWKLLDLKNGRGESIRVELLKNPFRCDCNLKSFISWLRGALIDNPDRIRDNEDLRCATGLPLNNTNMYIRKVEVTLCDPFTLSTTPSHVTSTLTWIFIILILVVIFSCCYAQRSHLLRKVSPIIHRVSSGVHYTSIDRNETAEITPV